MDVKLTILLTNYNKEKYVSYVLQQLLDQQRDGVQVVVLDDGSTDKSVEIIEEVLSNTPNNFEFYKGESNIGSGPIRQLALSKVEGEYFIFVDSDDMISEQYVDKILEYCKEQADVHIFRTRVYPLGGITALDFSLWDKVIRTQYVRDLGIDFDPALKNMEDYFFMNKLWSFGNAKVEHHNDILYFYNIFGSDTLTHQEPIWYNHNLDGMRPEVW